MEKVDSSPDIKAFQKRYRLSNKDMARVCRCSLPTIQKWRSGEVAPSGAATQLFRLLDFTARGNPAKFRETLATLNQAIEPTSVVAEKDLKELETSMTKVMDRLDLMLEGRRKDKELAGIEARYLSMVESLNDPVCRWLPDTTLTYVNEAYASCFDLTVKELTGSKWMDLIPEGRRKDLQAVISDLVRRGEPETMYHEVIGRGGATRYQEWRDVPIKDSRGNVVEVHSIGRDVTELHQLRQRVDQLEKLQRAMMTLCDMPLLVFDAEGNFVEMNDLFRVNLLADHNWKYIAEMVPSLPKARFKRLLNRLSGKEQINYRLKIGETVFCMSAKRLGTGSTSLFIGVFNMEERSDKLVRVRLAKEVIIDGEPVDFLIDPDSRSLVEEKMGHLGRSMRVDRVYVFTLDYRTGLYDNVLEWCAEGIEPEIENLKRLPMDEYSWWIKRIRKHQWIQFNDTSQMPRTAIKEQQVLLAQDIAAFLVAPLVVDDLAVGFVGFDQNFRTRIWHSQEVQALSGFKELLERILKPYQVVHPET